MGTIDGTDWSGVTIDGQEVQEITMDGTVVWSADRSLFAEADSYTLDTTPRTPTIDESTGAIGNLIHDNSGGGNNGVAFNFNGGTTRTFNFTYNQETRGSGGSTQNDRHWSLFALFDSNGAEILEIGIQYGLDTIVVYDSTDPTPDWSTYIDHMHNSGINSTGSHEIDMSWNNGWTVTVDGQWSYNNANFDNPAHRLEVGIGSIGSSQNSYVHNWNTVDNT